MNRLYELFKKYSRIIFIAYMCMLVLVLVLKFPTGMVKSTIQGWMNGAEFVRTQPQLVPFKTTVYYVMQVHSLNDWFIKNLACNLIMFIPYGFLTPFLIGPCKNMGNKVFVTSVMVSGGIEIFQYITALGLCDIDDLILNVTSAMIGYGLYKLIRCIWRKI